MDLFGPRPMPNMPQDPYMHSWTQPLAMETLAMARVAMQPSIAQVYNVNTALQRGTLFPELDKPFMGKRGVF